jgi:hypothetical protein
MTAAKSELSSLELTSPNCAALAEYAGLTLRDAPELRNEPIVQAVPVSATPAI